MRAIELTKRGVMQTVSKPSETLKPGQVLIQSAYAGLNFTDVIIKKGLYEYQKEHLPLPYTPGFEATGTVTDVCETKSIRIGEKVAVLKRYGCLSDEIVADEADVIVLPPDADLEWTCSLIVNFFTAFHALSNIVVLQPGSKILVTSAGGGVGGILTQMASKKHEVTALIGSVAKVQYALSLGATKALTRLNSTAEEKYDAVFTASGTCARSANEHLAVNGKIVVYGFHDLVPTSLRDIPKVLLKYITKQQIDVFQMVYNNQTVAGFNIIHLDTASKEFLLAKEAFLTELSEKTLTRHRIHTFSFDDYQKAFDTIADREHIGKVLLRF